jgi:hypothetical protein
MRSEAPFEMKDSQPGRTDIPGGEEGAQRAKLRVVIVEDSAIIRARLSEALSEIPNVAMSAGQDRGVPQPPWPR